MHPTGFNSIAESVVSAKAWFLSNNCIFGQFHVRLLHLERLQATFLLGLFNSVLQVTYPDLQILDHDEPLVGCFFFFLMNCMFDVEGVKAA